MDLLLPPGTYSVVEVGIPAGWELVSNNCQDIVVTANNVSNCTVVNAKKGNIIVVKQTEPDGNAQVFSFSGSYDNDGFSLSDGQQNDSGLLSPGTYSVSETPVAGWQTLVECSDLSNPSNIQLGPGETVTCTFTNKQAPTLTVNKVVTNNHGGSKVISDFQLLVNGNPVTSGQVNTLGTGSYIVSETGSSGYTGTFSGDCNGSGSVTLASGDSKTCTLTNDDIPGTLVVQKVVINDNGGTLTASGFTFSVNGGSAIQFEADGENEVSVASGTYNVTEPAVAGYTTTYEGCSDVFIFIGGAATCTITNNDVSNAATLVVIKHVINDTGGTRDASEFTMNVTGTNVSDSSFPGSETGVTVTLTAGAYSVDEIAIAGYAKTLSADCSGTIAAGETKTCTVTNNDTAPMCNGLVATIVGTPGNNVLIGSKKNDVIVGNGGNDVVVGGGGNDSICLGDGNDIVLTSSGNDTIDAGGGRNIINAGGGNNNVSTGNGNDAILTLGGNDTVNAGGGNNQVGSGGGSDNITGGGGNDLFNAGGGADTCTGGGGTNNLFSCETSL